MNSSEWKRQRQELDPEQERLREKRLREEKLKREQKRLMEEQERLMQEQKRLMEEEERLMREQEEILRNSEMSINDADRDLLNKIHLYFQKKNPQNSQMRQLSSEQLKWYIYNDIDTLATMIRAEEPNIRKFSLILHTDKLRGLSKEFYSKIYDFYTKWKNKYQDGGKKRTYRNKSNKKRKNTRSKKHLKKNKRKV
jgi:hypothetical protein